MKNNLPIIIICYFSLLPNIFPQEDRDVSPSSLNTCIYDFNEYFYPHGQNVTPDCYYNPNRQFGLFAPQPDTTDLGNSRFNLINIDYSPCMTMPGMQLYYDGPESGPGLHASGSVKLFIKDSTDNSAGTSTDERSRVELCYYPKHFDGSIYTSDVENETYFYRWNFFIPNDEGFIDEEVEGGWHIISQFHQVHNHKLEFDPTTGDRLSETDTLELNPDDQPPLYINYIHEENAPNNLRNIRFIYGYRTKDPNVPGGMYVRASHFGLEDGIKKGEWNKIVLKIKWSTYDSIGYMKAWVNDQPILYNPSEIDTLNPNYQNPDQYTIYGQNMLKSLQGEVVPNYLKVGHYRKYLNSPATIYFDNLIVTQNEVVANQEINAPFCGKTLTSNDMTLSTTPVLGNHQYIFRLENVDDEDDIVWQIDNDPTVYLGNNPNLKNNTTYSVNVKIDGHSTYEEYGNSCEISTDYLLELIPSDCSKTITSSDLNLSTNLIGDNNLYIFKLENIDDPTNIVWQTDYDPTVYLGNNPDLRNNTTYNVSVKIDNHPVFGEYGDICQIQTDYLLELIPADCGKTLNSSDMSLSTTTVGGVGQYEFKLENINSPNIVHKQSSSSSVYLWNTPGLQSNATYSVSVRKVGHPVFGEYGETCIIHTGNLTVFENKSESNLEKIALKVYPNPNSNNQPTRVSFKVTNPNQPSKMYLLNQKGVLLNKIFDTTLTKGTYNQAINTKNLKTGLYFIILENGKNKTIRKLIIK